MVEAKKNYNENIYWCQTGGRMSYYRQYINTFLIIFPVFLNNPCIMKKIYFQEGVAGGGQFLQKKIPNS